MFADFLNKSASRFKMAENIEKMSFREPARLTENSVVHINKQ
jgi:hypothetical protein